MACLNLDLFTFFIIYPLRNQFFNGTILSVEFNRGGEEFAKYQVSNEESKGCSSQDTAQQDD